MFSIELKLTNLWCKLDFFDIILQITNLKINKLDLLSNNQLFEKPVISDKESKCMEIFAQRTKVLQISLVAIFSAFVVELIFGLVSNSLALITDSIHALLDAVVTLVLLISSKMGN